MAKKNIHAKQGYGIEDPLDAIHLGEGKRIRLEDVPLPDADGDNQVGHRAYNDERYALRGTDSGNVSRFLKGGSWVWTRTGLVFRTLLTEYLLPGMATPIVKLPTDIDLAEFPELDNATNPQFARPQWDIAGNVIPIFGTADADPVIPEVEDPETQIAGSPVLLAAGEVVPEVPVTVVYEEYEEGEFAVTSTGTGVLDPDSTESPDAGGGTKSIKFSGIVNNDAVILTADADFAVADFTLLSMRLKLIAQFFSGHDLRVLFQNNAGTSVSSLQILNLQKANLDYQQVGIAFDEFTFSASLARRIQISFRRTRGATTLAGFYLDNVFLQGGIIPPAISGTIELTGHVAGTGETGTPINVTITEKAISDQTEQVGALPGTAQATFRLADGSLVKVAASLLTTAGVAGTNGWSPVLAVVTDGERRVLGVSGWTGGTGSPPASGLYVGASGLVSDIAEGVNIRGAAGVDAEGGGLGDFPADDDILYGIINQEPAPIPLVDPVEQEFTWTTGAQEFTLDYTPVGKIFVFVGTTQLRGSKWSRTGLVITITDTLPNPSLVVISYWKTALVGGYPEIGLSAENFFQLVENGPIYANGGNVPQDTSGGITLTFRKDTMYGTPAAPLSGAISEFFTGDHLPNVGAEAILWYNGASLTFTSGSKYKRIHGTYGASVLNKIIFRYYSDTYITYQIYQEL